MDAWSWPASQFFGAFAAIQERSASRNAVSVGVSVRSTEPTVYQLTDDQRRTRRMRKVQQIGFCEFGEFRVDRTSAWIGSPRMPMFDGFRRDPRFKEMLRRLNHPDAEQRDLRAEG